MQTTETTHSPYYLGEAGDIAFKKFQIAVHRTLEVAGTRLFMVDTEGLFENDFLGSFLDPIERQFHNCHCCRHFIERFGGLVTLTEEGDTSSAVWDPHMLKAQDAPEQYQAVARQLRRSVEVRKVIGQFLTKELILGVTESGGYSHFVAQRPTTECEPHLTAGQAMAVRKEDHKHLSIAISDMKPELVSKAVAMLEAGGLLRPESLLPMGKFLQDLQEKTQRVHGERRSRIIWHAVGHAARGWCTPRASAFGALVEEIASGRTTEAITRSHNERMDPLHYQRPQAPPSAGNIKQAEKLFEQLNLAPALRRRPMALEEAELFWRPRVPTQPTGTGVFGHLQPKGSAPTHTGPLSASTQKMTFAKFQRDVLPKTLELRALVPSFGAFCALTTATDPTAPPILHWDSPTKRNPGAWYLHAQGSYPTAWNLSGLTFVDVLGLSRLPPDWYENGLFHPKISAGRVLVILKGAADIQNRKGLALFPECLKSELHSVRSTIEAFSASKNFDEELRPRASGWLLSDNSGLQLEVATEQGKASYLIDRME